jgi:3-oxoacyl-[acyl-carrier-protein] synthase II
MDIAITGIGVICANGIGRESFWQNCLSGRSGIAPIQSFDTSAYRSHLAAEAREFNAKDFIPPLKYRRMSRSSRLAVAASIEAIQDAALEIPRMDATAIGVVMGTGYGSTAQTDEFFQGLLREGPEGANPGLFPDTVPNGPTSQISIYHGLQGPNTTFSHNEVSGELAIAFAARLLAEKRAKVLLAGAVDEFSAVLFHSYAAVRALSPRGKGGEGMRPFDRRRNGRVLGEGAAVLVLEEKASARERGARIYGTLAACASTGGPVGTKNYEGGATQMARAVREVLERGGISAKELSCISAAANSTAELDRAEALAIGRAFGGVAGSIPVSSLKGHIGEFCASGALRAAALLLSMREEQILPTLGLRDPEFALNHVLERPRPGRIEHALLNGFSFGGANCCLLFKNEK